MTSLRQALTIVHVAVWRSSTACGYIQETWLTSATEPRSFAGASYDLALSLNFGTGHPPLGVRIFNDEALATHPASRYSEAMARLPRNNAPRVSGIAYLDVSHAGETYRINLRRTAAARRFTLRVRAATQDVVLTMPARGSLGEAKSFAGRHAAWIGAKLRRLPEMIPFEPGAFVPLRGMLHRITHCPATRGRVLD